jgi:small-conductance mechanosensitive channel
LIILIGLPFILRSFKATANLANRITQFLVQPFASSWTWFQINLPDLVTIGVIILVTYLLIRLVRAFFNELGEGSIQIEGFDPEWAPFTSRIVAFLLAVGAVIISFPYIPGSDSEAFKGITIFLGALFTLSSTAAVANIVSGIIQTYTGAFSVGDVVRIGDVLGVVKEKNLLTTRVRTFKNEDVSIPNGNVLNSNVTNYTNQAEVNNLILYTTITIGYDVPWEQIHQLLIAAALETPDILKDPAPFVLQTSLNDYHVSYQLDCFTNEPVKMMRTYSALHANIQDKFNQAGVEIMSPAFTALRDGNTITIPEADRPEGYKAPGFRLEQGEFED